ncbi:HesA/MoeB/ThiF family protein [Xanthomonas campestris]|uniref:HesA/MoeB/ThiF family protein n=1 Tax=Xanthomonas campestris TaxID=339 RepID=UPI001C859592|nr:ThiF family adenylyltransferase [Xanthomonas campestris]MCC5051267.1 ThiF family adenylyltransferase [Xanthomonas campestris pv. aberrans]MEB1125963.1 ThiF family adenylyltransferase [Xanthomonas campestris pv. campestris]
MNSIAIGEPLFQRLIALTEGELESGAAVFLRHDRTAGRFLIEEVELAKAGDIIKASETEITFAPQFLTKMTRRAKENGQCIGLLHTHPSGFTDFSATDDKAEAGLVDFMTARNPGRESFSIMICGTQVRARRMGSKKLLPVCRVGARIVSYAPPSSELLPEDERFDRQVRAFGQAGQAVLKKMTVAVVGLGGTGSLTVQQLAHLGLERFVLIDGDTIEETNLNRVVGASEAVIGVRKVDVARTMIQIINPDAQVETLVGSVISPEAQQLITAVDCIFLCTDSHSSRAFVNQLAYQYLVPTFDMGVSITATEGQVKAVTGRVQMLAPGLPCLVCANAINYETVRHEHMNQEALDADPYFQGSGVKQPAVISLNSTAASLAVTMFLGAFTEIPVAPRWQQYNALNGAVRTTRMQLLDDCGICGINGVIAAADSHNLPFI